MVPPTHSTQDVAGALRLANGVLEFPMRRRAIARRLDAFGALDAVRWLDAWLRVAGDPSTRRLSIGVGVWLAEVHLGGERRRASLAQAAEEAGLELVGCLLRGGESRKTLPRRGRLPEARIATCPGLAAYRPRRSWFFSEAERHRLLHALEQHPDAAYVQRFLSDPDPSRRRSAIAVARRRPTTPALVTAVLKSRWIADPRVVTAVVENPFTPVGVAASLLPATGAGTWGLLSRIGPPPLAALASAFSTPAARP